MFALQNTHREPFSVIIIKYIYVSWRSKVYEFYLLDEKLVCKHDGGRFKIKLGIMMPDCSMLMMCVWWYVMELSIGYWILFDEYGIILFDFWYDNNAKAKESVLWLQKLSLEKIFHVIEDVNYNTTIACFVFLFLFGCQISVNWLPITNGILCF